MRQDTENKPNSKITEVADRASSSRPSASAGLTPAQLAAALAVVRHHADRMAQRRTSRSESQGEPRERG